MTQKTIPSHWIDKIFCKLQGIYGREFTGQYSTGIVNGVDAGLENAKTVWAEQLADLTDRPEAIGYALDNLPERAPNGVKFLQICKSAPRKSDIKPLKLNHIFTKEEREENRKKAKKIIADLVQKLNANNVTND